MLLSTGKEGSSAGAVDEEDFIRAFEDVPTVQVKPAKSKCMFYSWPEMSLGFQPHVCIHNMSNSIQAAHLSVGHSYIMPRPGLYNHYGLGMASFEHTSKVTKPNAKHRLVGWNSMWVMGNCQIPLGWANHLTLLSDLTIALVVRHNQISVSTSSVQYCQKSRIYITCT